MCALLAYGANPNVADRYGNNALHLSLIADNPRIEIARMLVESKKCDVNTANALKQTPLMLACTIGSRAIVEQLLHAHADVNLHDERGRSALGIAKQYGKEECVNALLGAAKQRMLEAAKPTSGPPSRKISLAIPEILPSPPLPPGQSPSPMSSPRPSLQFQDLEARLALYLAS